jgi:zinc transport system substrate-binding protein
LLRIVLILIVLGTAAPAGCGGEGAGGETSGRTVIAAFYPLAFAAARIAEDGDEVVNLTPAGAEPHDVELSARDVERIRAADAVFYVGGGFQPALERALEGRSGEAVDVLDGLDLLGGEEAPVDPHVWLDPLRFARIAAHMGVALGRVEAAGALVAELEALDGELERGLASCERRELATSHAAFGYLAERYRLEQIALSGLSPEVEPSARDLERLVERVRESGATTVFFETLVSPRIAETVAREAGVRTDVLDPLEGLTEEATAAGDDYLSVMRANLQALRRALGCR